MKTKKSFLFLFIVLFGLSANAQFRIGIRGGFSSSSIKMSDVVLKGINNQDSALLSAGKSMTGYHIGAVGRISIGSLYIQPELLWTTSGGTVHIQQISTKNVVDKVQKLTKMDIPIMVGNKFGPLRLQAGPIASFVLSNSSFITKVSGAKEDYKKATWGYQAGFGLDLGRLAFDLKYEGNLSKLGSGITFHGKPYNFDSRNTQWVFSFAWFFMK